MEKRFDILFLVDDGIGNAIEILFAVEYCLLNNKKTGLFLNKVSVSFVKYLQDSYGSEVILDRLDEVATTNLIHSWLYAGSLPTFDSYFLVSPNHQNTFYLSETEQYLSIVKSLYPSGFNSKSLAYLKENFSARVKVLNPETKYILYAGCASTTPSKRWPYYRELISIIGSENVILIGGNDDLVYDCSYYYPKWITILLPHRFLRKQYIFNFLKKIGLLLKHAHFTGIEDQPFSFYNFFTWTELTALLRRAKYFIGNDGGISHLAGACGTVGSVIFGPSSVNKNKPYSDKLIPIATSFSCQPCQFIVNNKDGMAKNSILCPYQLRCLYDLKPEKIYQMSIDENREKNNKMVANNILAQ